MSFYQPPTKYDSAEWTQALATNYDVSAQALFVNCKNPTHVIIRTDTTMTVKFNATTNPAITVAANTEFSLDFNPHAIFITTTGSTAVKIVLTE
jgi:hypothetical protein